MRVLVEARFVWDGDREGPDPSAEVWGAKEREAISLGKNAPKESCLECLLEGRGAPAKEGMTKFLLGREGRGIEASKENSLPSIDGDVQELTPSV